MSDIEIKADEAVRLWEETVGDSGRAPEDEELHAFAVAVERAAYGLIEAQVRAQIAAEIEEHRDGSTLGEYRNAYRIAALIARGES